MKRAYYFLGLFLFVVSVHAQQTSTELQFDRLNGPTSMDWLTQRFLIHQNGAHFDAAFGLETQSAIFGDYGGFYVFGLHGRVGLEVLNIKLWSGMTVATGGGASAPDGDGLMYRFQTQASYPINKRLSLAVGANTLDFPTGDIRSNHLSYSLNYTMPYQWSPPSEVSLWGGSISVLAGVMLFDGEDASRITERGRSFYNGVRFSQSIAKKMELDLQLGASAVGETDGFMDYKAGISYVPFLGNFQPIIRGQIGSGGGGGVYTGGGFAVSSGIGMRLWNAFEVGCYYWNAAQTTMEAPYLEVAYRVPFESNFAFVQSKAADKMPTSELNVQRLILVIGNRTNLAQGQDRSGSDYRPMSSIFLGAKVPLAKRLYASGETLWAATGGYGAYAEGMFGGYYDAWTYESKSVGVNASVVVAGGGGIEVGRGTALAMGLHARSTFAGIPTSLIARYKYFGPGAYNPLVLGVQFEPNFKVYRK